MPSRQTRAPSSCSTRRVLSSSPGPRKDSRRRSSRACGSPSERAPVMIADVNHTEVLNPILREKGVKSLLGVPLVAHERVLGIIHVGTLSPRTFSAEDVELLEVVAQRVALGVDRATLYDELTRITQVQRDFIALAAHELRSPATTIL